MEILNEWIRLTLGKEDYLQVKHLHHKDWIGLKLDELPLDIRDTLEVFTFGKTLLSMDELNQINRLFNELGDLHYLHRLYTTLYSEFLGVKPVLGLLQPTYETLHVCIIEKDCLMLRYILIPITKLKDNVYLENLNRNYTTTVTTMENLPIVFGFQTGTTPSKEVLWAVDKYSIDDNALVHTKGGYHVGDCSFYKDRILMAFNDTIKYYDKRNGLISFRRNDTKMLAEILCMSEVSQSNMCSFSVYLDNLNK